MREKSNEPLESRGFLALVMGAAVLLGRWTEMVRNNRQLLHKAGPPQVT